ncbi:MAG TPA: dTMP kinase [Desulfobacterales bacterium]|nr:dTMP kinase [Desulfobacterales bacterium]
MDSSQPAVGGRVIAFEGVDGVGKTTQAHLLAQALSRLGLSVILTREPTTGPWGQQIRQILLHGRQGLTPKAELELFIADRREHVAQVIRPALVAGQIVITDRYYFSSMAYQGALGLDPLIIQQRHETFAPRPDLAIILTLPLTEVAARLEQRSGQERSSFEDLAYLTKVAQIFSRLHAPYLQHLDGRDTIPAVHARILTLVHPLLKPPRKESAPVSG